MSIANWYLEGWRGGEGCKGLLWGSGEIIVKVVYTQCPDCTWCLCLCPCVCVCVCVCVLVGRLPRRTSAVSWVEPEPPLPALRMQGAMSKGKTPYFWCDLTNSCTPSKGKLLLLKAGGRALPEALVGFVVHFHIEIKVIQRKGSR